MNYHFELFFFIAILLKSIWAKPDKTSISEPWIVHFTSDWFDIVSQLHKRSHRKQNLINAGNDAEYINYVKEQSKALASDVSDGENVDVIEHFFWKKKNGVAVELGALTGAKSDHSMTYDLENSFGWKRVLIEGNPTLRDGMKTLSPGAFSINSAICRHKSEVHYVSSSLREISGIVEFMTPDYLRTFHKSIYDAGVPPGNIANINWSKFPTTQRVDCLPLTTVLHRAGINHVNFFILDTEVNRYTYFYLV
jgi:hypothetical protein